MSVEPARLGLDLEPLIAAVAERVAATLGERSNGGYLDADAAAKYLCCPRGRVYELAAAGRVRHHRDGRRILFTRQDLDAALETIEPRVKS